MTGSGAVYTVTASTGTGTGTLRLNLVDTDSIADIATQQARRRGQRERQLHGGRLHDQPHAADGDRCVVPLANGSYTIGQVVPVTVTFSKPVFVTGTPRLALATTAPATTLVDYSSGSGTATLTFEYTVVAGNASGDLNYVATTSLTLNDGTIQDAVTNNATLTLPNPVSANSLRGSKAIVIDTVAPLVTATVPANNASTNDNTPTLTGVAGNLTGDSTLVTVTVYSGTGTGGAVLQTIPVTRTTTAWTTSASVLADGRYTVQAVQADLAGNTRSSVANTFTVDTVVPDRAQRHVAAGEREVQGGSGGPGDGDVLGARHRDEHADLALATGVPATTNVSYSSGSGTATLTFDYTVAGAHVCGSRLRVDRRTGRNHRGTPGGANADLTLPAPGTAGSLGANDDIVIDTSIPTVTGVSSPLPNGSYRVGQVVPVTVTFSEAVTVTGTPLLTVSTGSPSTTALSYVSGSGYDDADVQLHRRRSQRVG